MNNSKRFPFVERTNALGLSNVLPFLPVVLTFAWTKSNDTPVVFGHTNFFEEFDVSFYRADLAFEISQRTKQFIA